MLEGVLCNIMARPGITHQSLLEHYKAVLQPMALLDLLEVNPEAPSPGYVHFDCFDGLFFFRKALVDLGCVRKKTLVKSARPSLFSPRASSEARPRTEDPDTVFYEPTLSCCLRLSQALPNERHWNYCLK